MKSKKDFFKDIFKELFVVTLGVLIALGINSFVQERKDAAFLQKSLTLIRAEHQDNLEKMKNAVASHKELKTFITNNVGDDRAVGEIILQGKGFQAVTISRTAWNKLLSKHIELIDYDILQSLNNVENKITFMEEHHRSFGEVGYQRVLQKDQDSKLLISFMLQDVINAEEGLVKEYEDFEKLMDHKK